MGQTFIIVLLALNILFVLAMLIVFLVVLRQGRRIAKLTYRA